MDRLGLLAGSGNFPIVFAKEAKKKDVKIIAFAAKDITEPGLANFVDRIHWIDVNKFKIPGFLLLLMTERIKKIVMVGKIDKSVFYKKANKDNDYGEMFSVSKDNMDYSMLNEITKGLKKVGVDVVAGTEYLENLLPEKGVLSRRQPSEKENIDIEFGMRIAKEIVKLDIGQTITVKNKMIVSIEAMEGTDEVIKRATDLVGHGFTVIKLPRPNQDMRWDVPLIGPDTIKTMAQSGASVLVFESGKMYFMDRDNTINQADLNNIAIVCV